MPDRSDLAVRMKENYEKIPRHYLMKRTPVAIRLDGKAFHTFTRGFKRPYDKVLGDTMVQTMKYLCENIQGCVFGYTQSDEITLILIDYQTFDTAAWFDYRHDKLCSITASMTTLEFNRRFAENVDKYCVANYINCCNLQDVLSVYSMPRLKAEDSLLHSYVSAMSKGAMFDSRAFNIPKEEVCNLVFWRQLDATRNSIQMMGQAYFSQDQLHEKTCSNIQDMLMEHYKINWNDTEVRWKRGVAWKPTIGVDYNMPILKGESRRYVEEEIFIIE